MSAHLERAQLLLRQSRPVEAEREALQALHQSPGDPLAYAFLALSRVDQRKKAEALEAAVTAVGLAPDEAYFHYVQGLILHRLDRDKEALACIREAIRLDPADADSFSLLASVHLALREWPAALQAAEQALALNAEHVGAANLRSMALVRLGRKEEAMTTVEYALARAPENAWAHANQGWNCLHANDPQRAQHHFREALRLEPDMEYARQGMLEALKARNPLYRGMLRYFLWMGRLSSRMQWVFIIALYVLVRFTQGLARTNPAAGPVLWPLVILFNLFIYLSWTAGPMFNLLLRFDRFGRYVLSQDERRATNWFGACVSIFLIALIAWPLSGQQIVLFLAIWAALLSICVAATFAHTGRSRLTLAIGAALLAVLGLTGLGMTAQGYGEQGGFLLLGIVFVGFLGFQVLANLLRSR